MSVRTKREYLLILRQRYQDETSKSGRSRLLAEGLENTGLHRKSLIRAMGRADVGQLPKLGRPRAYSPACIELLKRLYRASGYICVDRLKEMIPILLGQIRMPLDADAVQAIKRMSASSMDRYLGQYRGIERRRRNSGTRPGSKAFKKLIPLKNLGNLAPRPGYLQADTVAHCGGSLLGRFAWSLTVTDEKVGWTQNRLFMGKAASQVLPALKATHEMLPFDLIAINVDNGSEFLNYHVYEYYRYLSEQKVIPFPMSRSRPYKKNDNPHAEQKNWTHVRQLFGYERIEHDELIPLMNEIYRVHNMINNYFVPQFKLKSKVRIGAKIKKTYDKPKTPYQRLLEEPSVSDAQKKKLQETFASLNYFDLLKEKEELLARFFALQKQLKSGKVG
jgi:hypothetical protein